MADAGNAGAVDQDVEAAEVGGNLGEQGRDLASVADIGDAAEVSALFARVAADLAVSTFWSTAPALPASAISSITRWPIGNW